MADRGLWSSVNERTRVRFFAAAALVAFTMAYWVKLTGAVLQTAVSKHGIVSLELAGSADAAQIIYEAWGESGRAAARVNIQIDFLYVIAYGTALSLGCAVARGWWARRAPALAAAGAWLTWAMPLAALSDAAENVMMLRSLADPANTSAPPLARLFALVKFALLAVGLLYIMMGAISQLSPRRRSVRAG